MRFFILVVLFFGFVAVSARLDRINSTLSDIQIELAKGKSHDPKR